MKHLAALFALLCTLLAACSPSTSIPYDTTLVKVEGPRPRAADFTFHADADFTATERVAIVAATNEWRTFSSGRVDLRVAFDLDFNSIEALKKYKDAPVIIRAESWMSVVQDEPGNVIAYTNGKRQIVIIVDRVPSFLPIVMHEMGHAAGLRWPDWCPQSPRGEADCDHSPDLNSIMSAAYRGVRSFTDADRAFCRASGHCP